MQRSVEARLQKLETLSPEPDPWDELSFAQLTALDLMLRAVDESGAVTDEILWNEGISRDKFEIAQQSLTPELLESLATWCNAHRD
jgi:hypothetical protein